MFFHSSQVTDLNIWQVTTQAAVMNEISTSKYLWRKVRHMNRKRIIFMTITGMIFIFIYYKILFSTEIGSNELAFVMKVSSQGKFHQLFKSMFCSFLPTFYTNSSINNQFIYETFHSFTPFPSLPHSLTH